MGFAQRTRFLTLPRNSVHQLRCVSGFDLGVTLEMAEIAVLCRSPINWLECL